MLNVESNNELAKDLGELYENKVDSDATIIVGNQYFSVHKVILLARSPALVVQLEENLNQLHVTDISPRIFEKVLKYIYTDQISDLDLIAAEVLEAADKLRLHHLKELCEKSLCQSSNQGNIVEMLILADRHNAQNLKEYATECIIEDAAYITGTEEFKNLEKTEPALATEVLKKAASRKEKFVNILL
ncbi:hypothetical protein KQX54_018350 [Cotesia glomerata]|uniref:BTB domain-containing protein n=1 Tax=Cotesia glomerata TaxID=32391 RepID=A0AAV7HV85_COTGL|nr:hypothetical protein KQX54_018350 [Cotesia glomerata]